MLRLLASLSAVTTLLPAQSSATAGATPPPRTHAEATDHAETSRAEHVKAFVGALAALPHGDRLTTEVAGKSHEGRDLLLVRAALPAASADGSKPRLRALVIGSIHAGECEGKEALQALLREFALGDHADVLAAVDVHCLPIYNVDGNEAVDRKNRPGQNGPDVTGRRANAQGLDLNRDFVKAEAPETRALLALFTRLDPHLFVDLHTTNGSYHGYHLTYAPSLSPNVDPGVARLSRALLDDATAALRRDHGFATFDYGNFETRDWDGGGAPSSAAGVRGWYTYDWRPRYGVNYFGLRNRVGILSEAYSYCDFATRIAATRAFVLALLRGLARRQDEVRATCAAADLRLAERSERVDFGFDTAFGPPETLDVLVGDVDTVEPSDGGTARHVRKGDGRPERMPVLRAFAARRHRQLPDAWAILAPPRGALELLQRHGVQSTTLDAPRQVRAERFAVTKKRKPKRPFQGHQELVLEGEWQRAAAVELPAGTVLVPARQPLARLAAHLFEAESEDSLSSWNHFEAQTTDSYPVLRVVDAP